MWSETSRITVINVVSSRINRKNEQTAAILTALIVMIVTNRFA